MLLENFVDQPAAQHLPLLGGDRIVGALQHDRGAGVAEDEVVVASAKLLWPDVISGCTTTTQLADPLSSASTPACMLNVADEHATFMSYAQPPAPIACWISMATAGYARCRFEQPTITQSTSSARRPAWASASAIAGSAISACRPSSSSPRSGRCGRSRSGSSTPTLSIT